MAIECGFTKLMRFHKLIRVVSFHQVVKHPRTQKSPHAETQVVEINMP